jgi:hypothetical protein
MPRWLTALLKRVHGLAEQGKVRFTLKALRELFALGLDVEDAISVIAGLRPADAAGRLVSQRTHEWLYVFKPRVDEAVIYLKLAVRTDCIVVSFHEDEEDDNGEKGDEKA